MGWHELLRVPRSGTCSGDWAVVTITSDGVVMIMSDYGTWGAYWGCVGPRSVKEFLLQCDDHYLGRKIASGTEDLNAYLADETYIRIREEILQRRRERYISKDKAREEWELLEWHNQVSSPADLTRWHDETRLEDANELLRYGFSDSLKEFLYRVWPRIRAALESDRDNPERPETWEPQPRRRH